MQQFTLDILMTDGTRHEGLRAVVADQVLYSTVARKHGWGSPQEDQLMFQNFLAYAVAKRTGLFAGSWDAFCEQAAAVALDHSEAVDPTTPTIGGI